MVMLDMMVKQFPADELVVATFDHGMRESSFDDAEFVEKAAKKYGVKVYMEKATLPVNASEEQAREKRYGFLKKVAKKESGDIFTAHHLDDLIESIAINCLRGTGPRGLAVLNSPGVRRPFIDGFFREKFGKNDILKYASKHAISFRQDPTNTSDKYLRNRVRSLVAKMEAKDKNALYELWKKQKQIYEKIDLTTRELIPRDLEFERRSFAQLDDNVSLEILRAALLKIDVSATRPQIFDFLKAIRTYRTGKQFNLPNDKLIKLNRKDFKLEV